MKVSVQFSMGSAIKILVQIVYVIHVCLLAKFLSDLNFTYTWIHLANYNQNFVFKTHEFTLLMYLICLFVNAR